MWSEGAVWSGGCGQRGVSGQGGVVRGVSGQRGCLVTGGLWSQGEDATPPQGRPSP